MRKIAREVFNGVLIAVVIVTICYAFFAFYFYGLILQVKLIAANAHVVAEQFQYEADRQAEELLFTKEIEERKALFRVQGEWLSYLNESGKKGLKERIAAYLQYRNAYHKAKAGYNRRIKAAKLAAERLKKEAKQKGDAFIRKATDNMSIFTLLINGMINNRVIMGYLYDPATGEILPFPNLRPLKDHAQEK